MVFAYWFKKEGPKHLFRLRNCNQPQSVVTGGGEEEKEIYFLLNSLGVECWIKKYQAKQTF